MVSLNSGAASTGARPQPLRGPGCSLWPASVPPGPSGQAVLHRLALVLAAAQCEQEAEWVLSHLREAELAGASGAPPAAVVQGWLAACVAAFASTGAECAARATACLLAAVEAEASDSPG